MSQQPWIIWLGVALACLIAEMLTPGMFVFACFAVAALLAALCAWLGLPVPVVWGVFLVGALALIFTARNALSHYLAGELHPSNVDEMLGREGIVTEAIGAHQSGVVKIGSETWRARSSQEIAVGAKVNILKVDGNHLIVEAK